MSKLNRLFLAIPLILLSASAPAADLTWGVDGAGGTGTWDTSPLDWFNGTNSVAWPSYPDFASATFSSTSGTVTIAGNQGADHVTFDTPGYVLSGFLLDTSPSGLTVTANADATISAILVSDSGVPAGQTFTKDGSGTR